jgi:hypothetical protein
MRIVTWNCCGGFESKYRHLDDLGFDIAVVQECAPLPTQPRVTSSFVNPTSNPRAGRHLGLFARYPWTLTPLDVVEMPWLIAARVEGPLPHAIVGVWTQTPSATVLRTSYTAQVASAIEQLLPQLEGPVVVAGDFNAPGNDSDSTRRHQENVDALQKHGLSRAGDGGPPQPTYFHQRKQNAPFFIDHIFIPDGWNASTRVGTFDDWVATSRSDHVPVFADVAMPPADRD